MRRSVALGVGLVLATGGLWLALGDAGQTAEPAPLKTKAPTSNQVLMRDKLKHASVVLDGLAVEDFEKIAEAAKLLGMISEASTWHVIDSPEYIRYSHNFQEYAASLERHARQKNLDGAALDFVSLTMNCVQCHKYVRSERAKPKQ